MTSKNLFFNTYIMTIRNHIWSIALTCFSLFLAFPVYAALCISIMMNRVMSGSYGYDVLPALFRRDVLGEGNFLLIGFTIVVAVIVAFNGFSYLFSRSKVDMYHSVPIKRGTLFAASYLAGVTAYVVPYVVFMLVAFGIAGANGFLNGLAIKTAFIMLLMNLLLYLAVYTVSIIAVLATGTLPVAIVAIIVLFSYEGVIRALLSVCKNEFFHTASYFSDNGKTIFCPFRMLDLTGEIKSYYGVYNIQLSAMVWALLYLVIAVAIAYLLHRIRPSEAAGVSIAFKRAIPVISVALLVPIAMFGGMIFESFANENTFEVNYGWLIFGAALALLIGHFVLQAIYYRDFRSLLKNMMYPVVAGALSVLFFAIFMMDVFGYDKYLPSADKVESLAFNAYGLNDSIEYYNLDAQYNEYGYRDLWVDSTQYRFEHMNISDYELIRELASIGQEDTQKYISMSKGSEDYEETFAGTNFMQFDVQYKLKNGKEVYRQYSIDIRSHMDLYDRLCHNREYKEGIFDILTIAEDDIDDFVYRDELGVAKGDFTTEQMKELVEIYQKELLAQGAYELKDEMPIGYICKDVNIVESDYTSQYSTKKGYVYPSFTETIAFLKEAGVDTERFKHSDRIQLVAVTNYHYEEDHTGEEMDRVEYTDPAQMEKILDESVSYDLGSVNMALFDIDRVDVAVHLVGTETEYQTDVSRFFIKGNIPDDIANDVNYTSLR